MKKCFEQFRSPGTVVFLLLSVAVMVIIFLFSCEDSDNSSQTSGEVVQVIIDISYSDFDQKPLSVQEQIYNDISHLVRKTAHFSVYTALGFCLSMALGRKKLPSMKSLLVIGICFLYACSDEIHQYFVPGRACRFTDVLIDTCGSFTGLLFSMLVFVIIDPMKKKKADTAD